MKSEQEEYAAEGIQWKQIPFFNNKIVCELIESRRPPGLFLILDDVCATMHAQSEGADRALVEKLTMSHSSHPHYTGSNTRFTIKHFAGNVTYTAADFPDKNKDQLFNEVILAIQTSGRKLIQVLFPDEIDLDNKKRPPTAGSKIRQQCADLVATLMKCQPHYVRTIKSNDLKKANTFDTARCSHQVQYLGLLENIKVRRAGFAYRAEFYRFVQRFKMLSSKTWPREFKGSDKDAAKAIVQVAQEKLKLSKDEIQLGRTKIFIKQPETVFDMDGLKEKKIASLVKKIQRCWRNYQAVKTNIKLRQKISKILEGNKERRRESFYRPFSSHYIELSDEINNILEQNEKNPSVIFSDIVDRIQPILIDNSKGEKTWKKEIIYFICTETGMYSIIETPTVTQPQNAPKPPPFTLQRYYPYNCLSSVTLSPYADNYLILTMVNNVKKQSVNWIPDNDVQRCQACGISFGLFNRRQ